MTALEQRVRHALSRPRMGRALRHATHIARTRKHELMSGWSDFHRRRERAAAIRRRNLDRIEDLLAQFQTAAHRNGIRVLEAASARDAVDCIGSILEEHRVTHVVKGKSMTSEEIGLNAALQARGITVVETDLGEFLVQLAGHRPAHITAPAIHLSATDIARLLAERMGYSGDPDPRSITRFVRDHLRQEVAKAGAGLTGANFLVADSGTLVLVENEGNIGLTTTLPPVHIAIVGLEKVVATAAEAAALLDILPPAATAQRQSVYTTWLTGPAPTAMHTQRRLYVILLDNGRRRILADPELRDILRCIRCGACATVCPVFQNAGGMVYGSPYSGAMGLVWNPLLWPGDEHADLPFFSTLCGACRDACPVQIDLPRLIVTLRERYRTRGLRRAIRFWTHFWPRLVAAPLGRRTVRILYRVATRIPGRHHLPGPFRWFRKARFHPPGTPDEEVNP